MSPDVFVFRSARLTSTRFQYCAEQPYSGCRFLGPIPYCNAPRSSPPTFSGCFPVVFSDLRRLSGSLAGGLRPCGWDRILACVGTEQYLVSGDQNLNVLKAARVGAVMAGHLGPSRDELMAAPDPGSENGPIAWRNRSCWNLTLSDVG